MAAKNSQPSDDVEYVTLPLTQSSLRRNATPAGMQSQPTMAQPVTAPARKGPMRNTSPDGRHLRPSRTDYDYWLGDSQQSSQKSSKRSSMTSRMRSKVPKARPDTGRKSFGSSPSPRASLDKALPACGAPNYLPREATEKPLPASADTVPVPRASLDKALPITPAARSSNVLENIGGLDAETDTVDVSVEYAKPVVHETIIPEVRHVTSEAITRDIHNHHFVHRVQPISDVRILPTKHYAPLGPRGELVEIPDPGPIPNDIVGPRPEKSIRSWKSEHRLPERAITPNNLVGQTPEVRKQQEREWIGEDGVRRTETTWLHPTLDSDHDKQAVLPTTASGGKIQQSVDRGHASRLVPTYERAAEAAVGAMKVKDGNGVVAASTSPVTAHSFNVTTGQNQAQSDAEASLEGRIAKLHFVTET